MRNADVAIVTERDPRASDPAALDAHLLAHAVKELFPDAQVPSAGDRERLSTTIFSYKRPFTPEDLAGD